MAIDYVPTQEVSKIVIEQTVKNQRKCPAVMLKQQLEDVVQKDDLEDFPTIIDAPDDLEDFPTIIDAPDDLEDFPRVIDAPDDLEDFPWIVDTPDDLEKFPIVED